MRCARQSVGLALVLTLALAGCECGAMKTGGADRVATQPRSKDAGPPVAAQKSGPPYDLGAVTIVWAEPPPLEAPTREIITQWAETALLEHPEFTAKKAGGIEVSGKTRVAGGEARDGSGQVLGSVFLELAMTTPMGTYTSSAFIGEALPGKAGLGDELPAFVHTIVDEVVHALVMELRAEAAEDEALLGMLSADDAAGWRPAIAHARSRKLKAAAPALLKLLGNDDREVVNLAAGALGVVGDKKAIPPLIDAGSRVEPVDRLPVLYAVGEIGGPEAIIYLETVEKNSADPILRNAARNALERARAPRP